MIAVMNDYESTVIELLKAKADVNAKDLVRVGLAGCLDGGCVCRG